MLKTRIDVILSVALLLAVIVSGQVRAADTAHIFTPTSSWLVGPAIPSADEEIAVPCVMYNQYDNGYGVRISGDKTAIYAMAFDFRQSVFAHGESYKLDLILPPDFHVTLPAQAHNTETLLLKTSHLDGVYNALKNARTLRLAIGENAMDFLLLGMDKGLERLSKCSENSHDLGASFQSETVPGRKQPDRMVSPSYIDQLGVGAISDMAPDDMREKDIDEIEAYADSLTSELSAELSAASLTPLPQVDDQTRHELRRPQAGEASAVNGRTGHNKSSDRSDAQKMNSRKISPGASETAQKAVPAGADELRRTVAASYARPGETVEDSQNEYGRDIVVNYQDPRSLNRSVDAVRRWRAIRGASLRETLANWSRHANIRLVWRAGQDFPLHDSFSIKGSYESAVLAILEQFSADEIRPEGKIYQDTGGPHGGEEKVLVVTLSGQVTD